MRDIQSRIENCKRCVGALRKDPNDTLKQVALRSALSSVAANVPSRLTESVKELIEKAQGLNGPEILGRVVIAAECKRICEDLERLLALCGHRNLTRKVHCHRGWCVWTREHCRLFVQMHYRNCQELWCGAVWKILMRERKLWSAATTTPLIGRSEKFISDAEELFVSHGVKVHSKSAFMMSHCCRLPQREIEDALLDWQFKPLRRYDLVAQSRIGWYAENGFVMSDGPQLTIWPNFPAPRGDAFLAIMKNGLEGVG